MFDVLPGIPQQMASQLMAELWARRSNETIEEWARRVVILRSTETRRFADQPYDASRFPWVRRQFRFFQDEPAMRELIWLKDSQSGLTTASFVCIGWLIENEPGNILYVSDTKENVAELSKRRLIPILECIGGSVGEHLESLDQTIATKQFRGCILRLAGGQSASGLISWPISYAFVDESETHPILLEGSTIALTRARFKQDDSYKMVVFTKPQDEPEYLTDALSGKVRLISGQGTLTADEFLSGTQEKLLVPCPRCERFQELQLKQINYHKFRTTLPGVRPVEYDKAAILAEQHYECIFCKGEIKESEKAAMVLAGEYHPSPLDKEEALARGFSRPRWEPHTHPYKTAEPGRVSAHISALYNFTSSNVTWGKIALKAIAAEGDDEKMKSLHNDDLGLPRPKSRIAGSIEITRLERMKGSYYRLNLFNERGHFRGPQEQLPIDPFMLGMIVDVQEQYFKFQINAYDFNGEPWVVDYGRVGDYDSLLEIADCEITSRSGEKGSIYRALMDCRYRRNEVLDFCFAHHSKFRPARGHDDTPGRGAVWPAVVKWRPGQEIEVCAFDANHWGNEVYHYRFSQFDPHKYRPGTPWARKHPRFHFPFDTGDDYFREVSNVHPVHKPTGKSGFHKLFYWKARPHDPDDFWDLCKLSPILWLLEGASDESQESPPAA